MSLPPRKSLTHRLAVRSVKIPLRLVLVVPFVFQVVAAVSLTSYLSFRNGQTAVQKLATQLMVEVGDRINQQLTHTLEVPMQIATMNVAAIHTGVLKQQDPAVLKRYLARQLQAFDGIHAVAIADTQNNVIGAERNKKGAIAITNGDRDTETQLNDDPWYSVAGDQQSPWRLLPTALEERYPDLIVVNRQRFKVPNQNREGMVICSVYLSQLSLFLKDLKIGDKGQAFIVERSGLLLAASNGEPLFRADPPKTTIKPQPRSDYRRLYAQQSGNPLIAKTAQFLSEKFGRFEDIRQGEPLPFALDDQRYFVHVHRLKGKHELEWLTVLVVPEAEFMDAIQHNNRTTGFLMLAALAASILVGWLTSEWIAEPILRLSRVSKKLAIGKWEQPIAHSRIAELEVLAHSFKQMTDHLHESLHQVRTSRQASEEKFMKIFRTSPDAINIVTLAEGRYVEVNDSFSAITGYSREETIGRTARELNLLPNLAHVQNIEQLLNNHQEIRNQTFDLRTKTGEIRTMSLSSEVIDLEGQRYILSVARDITDRQQAEAKLQRTTEALKEAQRLAHIGSWELDFSPEKITWSEELFRIFGCDPTMPEPDYVENVEKFVHPNDRAKLYHLVGQAASRGIPYETDLRLVRPDGSIRYVEAKGIPVFDDGGQVIRLVGTILDITERYQAEVALQRSKQQLQKITDSLPVYIAYLDCEQCYKFANKLYIDRFGGDRPGIYGTHIREVLGAMKYSEIQAYLEYALRGHPTTCTMEDLDLNGKLCHLKVILVPNMDDHLQIIGCYSLIIDITEAALAGFSCITPH